MNAVLLEQNFNNVAGMLHYLDFVHIAVFKIKSQKHRCVIGIGPYPQTEGSAKTCALEPDIKTFLRQWAF